MSWPDGRRFALGLSHDVDRIAKLWWHYGYYAGKAMVHFRFDQLARQVRSLGAKWRGQDPYWNFRRIMALEDDLGVRSTFFFLDERGNARWTKPRSMVLFWGRYRLTDERIRRVIRELHEGGWEIGVHGSYTSYRDEALLGDEKARLEAVVGESVKGVRQHYLRLDIPETWQRQARVGFAYDSSLGYSASVGFRLDRELPFYPTDPSTDARIPVLQIPLAVMDGPLMSLPDPWSAVIPLIDRVEKSGGVLTLNWHQRVFNPWELEDCQGMYVRIVQECLQRGAWAAPLAEIAEWSRSRLVESS
jgi:peptidoglycan/xylan/chitin deacetylase (PgdA/CDA1 family)